MRRAGQQIEMVFTTSEGEQKILIDLDQVTGMIDFLEEVAATAGLMRDFHDPDKDGNDLTERPPLLSVRSVRCLAQQTEDGVELVLHAPIYEGPEMILSFEPPVFRELAEQVAAIHSTVFSDDLH
jgi:hypothetical protein